MDDTDALDIPGARGEHGDLTPAETALSTLNERQAAVLELIGAGMRDGEAARALGLHRWCVWRWKRDCPEFLAKYKEARKITVSVLRAEAERRAMRGSDKLLEFLLCNYAPDQFRRTQHIEATGKDGAPLIPPEHAADRAAALLAMARLRKDGADPADDLV